MSYTNAEEVLPPDLLNEVQKYVQGEQIYIPRPGDTRLGWGVKNGTRRMLERRNGKIRELKQSGLSVVDLAEQFNLSPDSIRKILYSKRSRHDRPVGGRVWGAVDSFPLKR